MKKTLGEQRVRTDFNPSEGSVGTIVDVIKQKSAELINLCGNITIDDTKKDVGEFKRLVSLAQTNIEQAAMWAVKAATI